jgi:ribonuclease P protein component
MEPKSPDQDAPASVGQTLGRLKRRAEFQRVSRGRRRAYEAFTLQAAPRTLDEASNATARVGFTVTKKVGVAVVRNRIRRRLKEALRAASPLEARPDCDYVVMARREALARPFAELIDDLRQAFRAAGRTDKDGRRPGAVNTPKGKNRRP